MNSIVKKYHNIFSLVFPIIAYSFVILWAGISLRASSSDPLIGNIWLFGLFTILNGFYLTLHQRLLNKGKKMPFVIWVFQLVLGTILWWLQVKYFSVAYFSLFLIYQVYQFFLLMMPAELNQNWHRIFINSFFTGFIFPLICAQTVPFSFKLSTILQFLPAFCLIFFFSGFELLMTRSESRNTAFFGLTAAALTAVLIAGFITGRGWMYGIVLVAMFCAFLFFNKKMRVMQIFSAVSCICLILGIILLY